MQHFTVFLKATIGSIVNLILFVNGVEFFTNVGIDKFPLPLNFSLSISYSKSPIISSSEYKFTPKNISFLLLSLCFLFTTIVPVSCIYSYVKNKLLKAKCE